MRKYLMVALVPLTLAGSLTACDNEQVGTLAGAAAGAAAGRAIGGDGYLGVIVGAVAGAYLGNQVAKWLDDRDRQKIDQTAQGALSDGKTGESYVWQNADSGNSGSVTPNSGQYTTSAGNLCRDFSQTAVSPAGQTASGSGTACKQPDGTWKIVRG